MTNEKATPKVDEVRPRETRERIELRHWDQIPRYELMQMRGHLLNLMDGGKLDAISRWIVIGWLQMIDEQLARGPQMWWA